MAKAKVKEPVYIVELSPKEVDTLLLILWNLSIHQFGDRPILDSLVNELEEARKVVLLGRIS